jgi:hypothetical protein
VSYWGVLNENATTSGVYENFSLVVFPEAGDGDEPSRQLLVCYGIGTGGITEDADRLRMPWVSRYARAMLRLLRQKGWLAVGAETFAKEDLADDRIPVDGPTIESLGRFAKYDGIWADYKRHLPTACVILPDADGAKALLAHLLLYGKFREWRVLSAYRNTMDFELMPALVEVTRAYPEVDTLAQHVRERRFVILQGPPGTGKTYLALQVATALKERDHSRGTRCSFIAPLATTISSRGSVRTPTRVSFASYRILGRSSTDSRRRWKIPGTS